MGKLRSAYRVVRSVLFTAVCVVVGLFVALYVVISLPPVQNRIKEKLSKFASDYIGAPLTCERLDIYPFNEVRLHGVRLLTPKGERCVSAELIGAGISLSKLIFDGKIELSYAEIVGLDARLWKDAPDAPLNIQFLIDALSSKDKKKPPTRLDLKLHNVVIRRSSFSWDKRWIAATADPRKMDFNHLKLTGIKADIAIPRIANNDFIIDLRRLSFSEEAGFDLESLSCNAHVTDKGLAVSGLRIKLPGSDISVSPLRLSYNGFPDLLASLKSSSHSLRIADAEVTPSDFSAFFPPLFALQSPYRFDVKAKGSYTDIILQRFSLRNSDKSLRLDLAGNAVKDDAGKLSVSLKSLKLLARQHAINSILQAFLPDGGNISQRISRLGNVNADIKGGFALGAKKGYAEGKVETSAGASSFGVKGGWDNRKNFFVDGKAAVDDANLALLLDKEILGYASLEADAKLSCRDGRYYGNLSAKVPYVDYGANRFSDISFDGDISGDKFSAKLVTTDPLVSLSADVSHSGAGEDSYWTLEGNISEFHPAAFGLLRNYGNSTLAGALHADIRGKSPYEMTGNLTLEDFRFSSPVRGNLEINSLEVSSSVDDSHTRHYTMESDFCSLDAESRGTLPEDIATVRRLLSTVLPEYISGQASMPHATLPGGDFSLTFKLQPSDELFDFLRLPVRPLMVSTVIAAYDSSSDCLKLNMNAPYILQGKNKLIKSTAADISLSGAEGLTGLISTNMPLKNDRISLHLSLDGSERETGAAIGWVMDGNASNTGRIDVIASPVPAMNGAGKGVVVKILDSRFSLNGEEWSVEPASVSYRDRFANIDNILLRHDKQFLRIDGSASDNPSDMITVDLNDIDLQYVFDILNINYVNFGGHATGRVTASDVFSSRPILKTQRLFVKNLAYNESVLGDAELESHWDMDEKMVAINADIKEGDISSATVRGGVYVTRDSLSFDFNTDNTRIDCLQPFMSGFTSSVKGRATGHLKLYGTFADVDLGGRVFADTISMLVDQTNVVYSASDSVIFTPGRITIPKLRLYDKYGNSALLTGEVRHRFLHDAEFDFDVTNARHLLVFDTDEKTNGVWYGHIFANGSASIHGVPGLVNLTGNVSSARGSSFTFALDERETAADYAFLTFTDKRKEQELMVAENVEEKIEDKFAARIQKTLIEAPSIFALNLNLTVTPDATINLIMDPKAGDKIVAHGNGGIRFTYDTKSDEFGLYGKYVLSDGTYNFSLQDLILRNFTIRNGSSISFNGDPLQGILDIAAAYRVNANITDLDPSFANDPDLNRKSVPVDAVLNVTGDINSPEIKFDLDMPTMTPEVERKIRSLISTDEMMNIQAIYLLALNRFYTPEYSGSGQGGELASVASSTISSQISNIIGSLTDKFTLAPSFKSDRSDFSDLEFDLALSSSLFNNRLLINGNVGYRDKNTSLTTFVGDFDIEYLLNRSGSLRLKAYNHFNDASYYLKSALTTQGLGIIYRKEFDNPFQFLRKKKKK